MSILFRKIFLKFFLPIDAQKNCEEYRYPKTRVPTSAGARAKRVPAQVPLEKFKQFINFIFKFKVVNWIEELFQFFCVEVELFYKVFE